MWQSIRPVSRLAYLLALLSCLLRLIRTVKEISFEKLDSYNSEDELEQHVYDEDVWHVFQWVHDTVKHRLEKEHINV